MYKQLNLVPIYNIIFIDTKRLVLMGLRGGCGVGTAGCLWIGGYYVLWRLGGFGAVVLATLVSLELEGSREGILYDEIYIMIIEK